MAKVKLNTVYAGPNGTGQPGDVIEVSDAEAKALIGEGYASRVDGGKAQTATLKPVLETADVKR